jgi:hypothetical protein
MDPSASVIYYQLLRFQDDLSQHELIFRNPSPAVQTYIQTLVSSGFNLEFEYSTITNSARITHRPPIQAQPGQEDSLSFLEFEQPSSCQSSSEIPNAHDLPPSAEVDWNEVFSDQEQPNLFSPQHNEPMFSFECAKIHNKFPCPVLKLTQISPTLCQAMRIWESKILFGSSECSFLMRQRVKFNPCLRRPARFRTYGHSPPAR